MLKIIFIGNLTANPETRVVATENGNQTVCNFSVAVNRTYRGKKTTEYFRVACWNKQADNAAKYLHKGSKVCITASSVTTRAYTDQSGALRANMSVAADEIEYLTSKTDGIMSGAESQEAVADNDGFMDIPPGTESELPFM